MDLPIANPTPRQAEIIAAMATVFDPEIPVNIYELGLIYGFDVDADETIAVRMTLTSPHCPSAEALPAEVRQRLLALPGVASVTVDVVWDPPWDHGRMSETARLELGLD